MKNWYRAQSALRQAAVIIVNFYVIVVIFFKFICLLYSTYVMYILEDVLQAIGVGQKGDKWDGGVVCSI